MTYDTFICYRGKSVSDGISEKIACQIYNAIKDNSDFGRVFFAPAIGNYDFIDDAEPIISKVKRMIIVFCPDFFRGFLKEDGTPDVRESSTYNELLAAFRNENCSFVPVFLFDFGWNESSKSIINQLYGKNFNTDRLFHMTGLHLPDAKFSPSHVRKLINDDEATEESFEPCNRETLVNYLSYCIGTVVSEENLILLEDIAEKDIGDRFRGYTTDVYEFMRACNSERPVMLMPKRFIDEFNKQKQLCRLNDAEFCYWKLDFDSDGEYGDGSISVCSVCFGAILSYNFLKNDLKRMSGIMSEEEREAARAYVKGVADGAVNLLVALRSPAEKIWPSNWEFIARDGHINAQFTEGTINQTTLSLSTLLVCDFLPSVKGREYEEITEDEREVFKQRYAYFAESIEKLISCRISTSPKRWGATQSGWGYMPGSKQRRPLPTTFCFDVLNKFKHLICEWVEIFALCDTVFSESLREMSTKIKRVLSEVVVTFSEHQRKDGSFSVQGNPEAASSVTHTAKVLKTLLAFHRNDADAATVEKTTLVIERAIGFLRAYDPYSIVNGLSETEIFENFKYSDLEDSNGESYENSGELLYIDAFLKAAEVAYKNGNTDGARELFKRARDVFNRFSKEESGFVFVDGESGDDVLKIAGRNPNLRYPIFRLYFYRMVVDDFLKYLDLDEGAL